MQITSELSSLAAVESKHQGLIYPIKILSTDFPVETILV